MSSNAENVQENSVSDPEESLIVEKEESHDEPQNDGNVEQETESTDNEETDLPSDDSAESDDEPPLPEQDPDYDDTTKKKKLPEWMQKRLDREKRAADEERIRAEIAERKLLEVSAATKQPTPTTTQQEYVYLNDPNRPNRDNYNSDEEYHIAVIDYRDDRRANKAALERQQAEYQKANSEYLRKLKETEEVGQEKYKDFKEKTDYIVRGTFKCSRAMGEAIVSSGFKDDILYYLGSNLTEAHKIAEMNPIEAVRAITKIETRFEARKKNNITKAPKIISPLTGKSNLPSQDTKNMSQSQFEDWYKRKYNPKRMV